MEKLPDNIFVSEARMLDRVRACLKHYWQKLKLNTLGRLFVSRPGHALRRALAALHPQRGRPNVRVAIVAHVYYLELLNDIFRLRAVFSDPPPLILTVPTDRVDALTKLIQDSPGVTLVAAENRGRDIAPFLQLLSSGAFDDYDAVLKVHTKRSPHLIDGDLRRKILFAMLCGERTATHRILRAFEKPDTGLVGWKDSYRCDPIFWMANRSKVHEVSAMMGAAAFERIGFFEGSMFWFQPKALSALRELNLTADSFEAEAGQLDGTLHHAIERCFTIAAWSRGYTVRDLHGNVL